ncbi:DUF397 domain-containing protein [Actinoplanes sp. RD1]|uniref:DUF397 domain-containing protein n=1 Tax=Actinoplanes sp. RD1 TaxID=3064538 RepID=UPI0027409F24|nr:DUF397 domain-containing protein [Actinoplanes sp. RD1]
MASTTTEWKRSSYCADGACVEVALDGEHVAMRDAKDPQGPVMRVSRQDWQNFTARIVAGDIAR